MDRSPHLVSFCICKIRTICLNLGCKEGCLGPGGSSAELSTRVCECAVSTERAFDVDLEGQVGSSQVRWAHSAPGTGMVGAQPGAGTVEDNFGKECGIRGQ